MKTNIHFWSYLAYFFLEWEMFQAKVVQKIKTHVLFSVTFFFFRKSYCTWDNVKKYCRAGQSTDDNIAHVIACWITRATNAHTRVVSYSMLFHANNTSTNAPQCYVLRTLRVVFYLFAYRRGSVRFRLKTSSTRATNWHIMRFFFLLHITLLQLKEQIVQVYPIKHSGNYIYHPL